jgi:hypothetical protein
MHYYNNDTTTTNLNNKKEQPKDGPPSSFITRQSLLINLGVFGAGLAVTYLPKLVKTSESETDADAENKAEQIRKLKSDLDIYMQRNNQLTHDMNACRELETTALDQLHLCRSELQTERKEKAAAISQVNALKSDLDEFNKQLLEMRSLHDD